MTDPTVVTLTPEQIAEAKHKAQIQEQIEAWKKNPPVIGHKRVVQGDVVLRGYRFAKVIDMRHVKEVGWIITIKPLKATDGDDLLVVPLCELKRAR